MIRAIPQPLVSPLVAPLVAAASSQTISGFAYPGETLSMQGGAASYQWFVNSDNRGTAQTLLLTVDDIGKTVTGIRNGVTLPTVTVWTPSDISAVDEWWIASAGVLTSVSPDVAATNTQPVSAWVGRKRGWRFEQTAGASQPQFLSAGLNSRPSVLFDGANDVLLITSGTPLDVFRNKTHAYIISVVRDLAPTAGDLSHDIFRVTVSGGPQARALLRARDLGANTFIGGGRRQDAMSFVYAGSGTTSDSDAHVHTLENLYSSGITRRRLDGTQTGQGSFASSGSSDDNASQQITMGAASASADRSNAHHALHILANAELSATDRSRLERFAGLLIGLNIPLV